MPENKPWWSDKGAWILLALFLFQFLISFRPDNLAWDGVYYYAYARSIIFDGDLHLEDDMELAYNITPAYDFAGAGFEEIGTRTGRVDSPFAIGAGLLWIPWFALIYGLAQLATLFGIGPTPLTGFEWPFVWSMATVTAIYGWLSIFVAYRLVQEWASRRTAFLAAAVLMFVTPLWYYGFHEPFYAHPASAMTVALFVATWWRAVRDNDLSSNAALQLGALGGLTALVRWQNLAYMVLPLSTTLWAGWRAWKATDQRRLHTLTRYLLVIVVAALVVFSPQMAVWTLFYGRPWVIPQGTDFLDPRALWLPHVLLSPFHGLLLWMPVVIPALIGLIVLGRKNPELGWPLAVAFLLQIFINSCVRDWFAGGGYGGRRFTNTLIILLIGYAMLLTRRGVQRTGAIALGGLLVLHQWVILRYGFAERIGGRVIEMAPSYTWSADSPGTFLRQLAGYLPLVIRSPIESIVLPGSPLDIGTPWSIMRQLLLLAVVTGVLAFLSWGRDRLKRPLPWRWIAAGTGILIALFDVWVLVCA